MNTTAKTNAMRMLSQQKIPYEAKTYTVQDEHLPGETVANYLGINAEQLFKTLVLQSDKRQYFVCCIPTSMNLNLKKVAKVAGVKKIEMLPMKELLGLTGYVRGGCSPIGMKKQFPTFVDETAQLFDLIYINAGLRGTMLALQPENILAMTNGSFADLIDI